MPRRDAFKVFNKGDSSQAVRTGVHVLGGQVDQLARGLPVELDEHLLQEGEGRGSSMRMRMASPC